MTAENNQYTSIILPPTTFNLMLILIYYFKADFVISVYNLIFVFNKLDKIYY